MSSLSHHNRMRSITSDGDGSVARFKTSMEDSDSSQNAAKLLMQVRRIATNELINDHVATPVTPTQRPRQTIFVPASKLSLPNFAVVLPRNQLKNLNSTDLPNLRHRTVSICSQDLEESESISYVTPLQGLKKLLSVPDTPSTRSRSEQPGPLQEHPYLPTFSTNSKFSANSNLEEELPEKDPLPSAPEPHDSLYAKVYVGDTLPEGVKVKDVLRKKFSWKSFPELEEYLVDHRLKYLNCSNSQNYTKAQKLYNNELTQGLLDLATEERYVFDGFTFAAVRDRIRCFYKSFVQANKKKKRLKQQHNKRIRSLTM